MRGSQGLVLGLHGESPSCRGRLGAIGLLILLAFAFLVSRLWELQIEEGEHLRLLSEKNRLRLKRTPPLRGGMYDRRGRGLGDNRPADKVVLVPGGTPGLEETL